MATPIAVICADLQAREFAYRKSKELFGDDLAALAEVVQFTLNNEISSLLLAGDIVDSPYISDIHVIKLRKILRQFEGTECLVGFINGNHERGRFHRLELEGDDAAVAKCLDNQVIQLPGSSVRLAAYDWRRRKAWESLVEGNALADADVLLTHGLADQVIPFMGFKLDPESKPIGDFDLNWFKKYKLVVLGDYHKKWVWRDESSNTVFAYPGSMWQHKADEIPEKYFFVLNDDLTFTEHRLQLQRPFTSVNLHGHEDLEQLIESVDILSENNLPAIIRKPRVHVTIKYQADNLRPALEKLAQKAIVFERTKLAEQDSLSLSEEEDQPTRVNITELVKEFANPDEDPQLFNFLKQVVDEDVEAAITYLRTECGVN